VSDKREFIDVRVSRRILWVGAEAYPLQNIARAQTIEIMPSRGAAIGRYVMVIVLWLILGGVVALAIHAVAVLVVLALIVVSTIRLIKVLSRRTFYALVIETAGTPRTALVSPDKNQIVGIVRVIMDAIDNPQVEYHTTVENHIKNHIGDKIKVSGSQNVGKVSR
jgi:Family of unknown function (DUF6232)